MGAGLGVQTPELVNLAKLGLSWVGLAGPAARSPILGLQGERTSTRAGWQGWGQGVAGVRAQGAVHERCGPCHDASGLAAQELGTGMRGCRVVLSLPAPATRPLTRLLLLLLQVSPVVQQFYAALRAGEEFDSSAAWQQWQSAHPCQPPVQGEAPQRAPAASPAADAGGRGNCYW